MRLAVLGSTRGTHLHTLVKAIADKHLSADIEIVMSNKADAGILTVANSYGLPNCYINPQQLSREAYDAKISTILQAKKIQLIVLVGYMRILSKDFVMQWQNKIINIHPSLLPAHAGLMDLAVHEAAIASKAGLSGCTIHYVTEAVDAGPVLVQKKCEVLPTDTAEILKTRVQALEAQALVEAINRHSNSVSFRVPLLKA